MIDTITIKGYKSLREIELELKPINILIGSNGAGKSNFISFFEFLNHLYEQKLQEYIALRGGQEKILFQGVKTTDEIYARLKFKKERNSHSSNSYAFTLTAGGYALIFTKELLGYQGKGFVYYTHKKEAQIKSNTRGRGGYINKFLSNLRRYHFHDTGAKSPFNLTSHVENDQYYLYEKGGNLSAFLYRIRKEKPIVYKRIVYTIQSIAPYFSDFYLQPNEKGYLRLQWTSQYDNIVYGVNDFSDGTIRFIALCVLFLQPNLPETITIDEPELGLHPVAITTLSGMIKSASRRGCQIILATQSTNLIDHFNAEDIITVDQINGESKFERLDGKSLDRWLEEYSIGDLWSRNIVEKGQPNG